jgi:hypothetical protein
MNDISKITLSAEEQQLVHNSAWILTKRVIIEKVYHLFGDLSGTIGSALEKETGLPPEVVRSPGKIAKGENYRLLPYVLLDHPRCFDRENIFAVRTMFWWGNFFSMTLQLSGDYKNKFEEKLCGNIAMLRSGGFYLCVNEDQWQHNFDEDNYRKAEQLTDAEAQGVLMQKPFVKLAVKLPLERWNEMPVLMERSFFAILELLRS